MKSRPNCLVCACILSAASTLWAGHFGPAPEHVFLLPLTADANTIALYHLDEAPGAPETSPDFSGNGNTLAVDNTVRTTAGRFGNAVQRSTLANNLIFAADSASFDSLADNPGSGSFGAITVEAWVWIDSGINSLASATLVPLVSKANHGANNGWFLFARSEGIEGTTIGFQVGALSTHKFFAGGLPVLNDWMHIAGVFQNINDPDAGTTRSRGHFYINGVEVTSGGEGTSFTPATAIPQNNANFIIRGMAGTPAATVLVKIDEVRVSNIARTPVTPEPSSLAVITGALLVLAVRRRRVGSECNGAECPPR